MKCSNPCMFRYTWPGRDESHVCLEHSRKLLAVATALGMYLQLIPFERTASSMEWPECNQIVSETKENSKA